MCVKNQRKPSLTAVMDVKVVQINFIGLIGRHKSLVFLRDIAPLEAIDIHEEQRRILYDVVQSSKYRSIAAIFAGIVLCFLGP